MRRGAIKIVAAGVAMTVLALAVPAGWIGLPVLIGMAYMGAVALDH